MKKKVALIAAVDAWRYAVWNLEYNNIISTFDASAQLALPRLPFVVLAIGQANDDQSSWWQWLVSERLFKLLSTTSAV